MKLVTSLISSTNYMISNASSPQLSPHLFGDEKSPYSSRELESQAMPQNASDCTATRAFVSAIPNVFDSSDYDAAMNNAMTIAANVRLL